jgi:hypothetical protein
MNIRGQSVESRNARTAIGRCPTHGLGMSQGHPPNREEPRRARVWVECPRRDCAAAGWAQAPDDTVQMVVQQ